MFKSSESTKNNFEHINTSVQLILFGEKTLCVCVCVCVLSEVRCC